MRNRGIVAALACGVALFAAVSFAKPVKVHALYAPTASIKKEIRQAIGPEAREFKRAKGLPGSLRIQYDPMWLSSYTGQYVGHARAVWAKKMGAREVLLGHAQYRISISPTGKWTAELAAPWEAETWK